MNTNKYELKEKEIRRLKKRHRQVMQEIRDQPLQPLKEPFQRGWEVFYKLRDDLARRQDAPMLLEKLSMAFKEFRITKSVTEVKMIRSGIKGYTEIRNGKKVYVTLGPPRVNLRQFEYDKLSEMQKAWFTLDEYESHYYGGKRYRLYLPEHWLVMKVRPHIITHFCEKGGELESEQALITRRLHIYNMLYKRWDEEFISGIRRMETRIAISKFLRGEVDEIFVGRSQLY